MQIEIRPTRYGSATAQKLIAHLMEDLKERYGEADGTPVQPAEFDPPDGGFFVVHVDGKPVGCGAWRSWGGSEQVAEVKRVFVAPDGRRLGLARRIMETIEADARKHGRNRIILETGTGQPEAIAMYEALGYERIEPFGHYKNEPGVRCFGKNI
ncbi:GNAT family N-acetyltransferase [Allorhizocola rhizosphaerae]|uniref:GNAT family N-acetyltransferase n=1 Tax=Allorhizocola rhizosphaerae TaxID=1872709 RepID=UPI001FEB40E1|nr:GNAT family N-acetyltransferase [Allorhizocola rhizosphaerae]